MTITSKLEKKSVTCKLCSQSLSKRSVGGEFALFCCHGCQAVYNILSAKDELHDFQNHPLFKQAIKSGLVSNPELLESLHLDKDRQDDYELQKMHIEIQDMWCSSCCIVIQYLLLKEKGVTKCVVDWSTDLALIEFQPRVISKDRILNFIRSFGYKPVSLKDPRQNKISFINKLRFIVAAFCSINIMMFSYPLYAIYFNYDSQGYGSLLAWFSFLVSLPVITFCAFPIYKKCITSIRAGFLGMESLIVLAVIASFCRSIYELLLGGIHVYFDSMTVIITLVLLGKLIESKSKFSAKDSLIRLTRSVPKRGRKRFQNGQEVFVLLKDVQQGDLLVVLNGEKIPLDGVVVEGNGSCDESVVTGESLPVVKKKGCALIAGALLNQGWLCMRVTATPEETFLKQIVEMIEGDIGKKRRVSQFVDRMILWFVPLICLLSLASFLIALTLGYGWESAFVRAVSVLLISCPCAIGIAVPLVEAHMINRLAQMGILIRNRDVLFLLGKKCRFVFDKTGTLTEGKFEVISGVDVLTPCQKSSLKGLVSKSQHPVCVAINRYIKCEPTLSDKILEVPGRGMKSDHIIIGSETFLKENGIAVPKVNFDQPVTSVYFSENNKFVTRITLGDTLKEGVVTTLKKLPSRRVLLSGDSMEVVKHIANVSGFKEYYFAMNPLEKRNQIDLMQVQGEIVCMVGDGINDAPALAVADVGISVVNATDMSVQVSDVLLTSDRLDLLIDLRNLSIKGRKLMKQNLFWAFFYNLIGIGFAFFGLLSPLFSAFAMVTSSLIVTLNARRVSFHTNQK